MEMNTSKRKPAITWRTWGKTAFEEARATGRPVLLSISAVWCHWCHVMDHTTFSDEAVVAEISKGFIPVRVNTDARPDINAQYNMGGWPTVAILDDEAHAISGTTYLPPREMLSWLRQVSDRYDTLAERAHEEHHPASVKTVERRLVFEPSWETHNRILKKAIDAYDCIYGGFGDAPKFPMFDTIDLLLNTYTRTGDKLCMEIVVNTLRAMTTRGTYDDVEGGIFRYSTTRDWAIPHYEKMLLDNASLLLILANVYETTHDRAFISPAESTAKYMNSVLYNPSFKAWSGSQDADEEYYALPTLAERKKRIPPRIDNTLYVDWNGKAAAAMISAGRAFGRPEWTAMGITTLETIFEKCCHPSHGLAHVYDGTPHTYGLAYDTISYGAACVHAFEATSNIMWLERSRKLAERLIATHSIVSCKKTQSRYFCEGLLSRLPDPDDPPGFARPEPDFHENAYAALWFTKLAQAVSNIDSRGRTRLAAHSSLALCDSSYELFGILASPYALALAEYMKSSSAVRSKPPDIECTGRVCKPAEHVHRYGNDSE